MLAGVWFGTVAGLLCIALFPLLPLIPERFGEREIPYCGVSVSSSDLPVALIIAAIIAVASGAAGALIGSPLLRSERRRGSAALRGFFVGLLALPFMNLLWMLVIVIIQGYSISIDGALSIIGDMIERNPVHLSLIYAMIVLAGVLAGSLLLRLVSSRGESQLAAD